MNSEDPYIQRLTELLTGMFEWKNLPDDVDRATLERCNILVWNGGEKIEFMNEDFVQILYHSSKLGLVFPVTVTKDIIMKNLSDGTIQELVNEIIEKIAKSMQLYEQTDR